MVFETLYPKIGWWYLALEKGVFVDWGLVVNNARMRVKKKHADDDNRGHDCQRQPAPSWLIFRRRSIRLTVPGANDEYFITTPADETKRGEKKK